LWVLIALAGLVGLIVLLLSVPVDAALNLDSTAKPRFRLRLVWLFGLLSKELRREKEKPEVIKKPAKKKATKGRGIAFPTVIRILRTKGLFKQIINLIKSLFSQLKLRELAVNLRIGLGNPPDTGMLFAVIGPTATFLNLPEQYQLRLQPSFADEAVFEGYLRGVLRLQPIGLAWPVLRFALSPVSFRIVKTLVRDKWRRKK
jgi:hypothetical protein